MAPKKISAFMLFVTEWRKTNDGGFEMTIDQAVAHCSEIWKEMTTLERGPYCSKAKDANGMNGNRVERLNCYGHPVTHVEQDKRQVEDRENLQKRTIERMVMDAKNSDDLENAKFVLVAFNVFTEDVIHDVYVPAEFSACEFSLKDGVRSVYSTLIAPDSLIFGHASDAIHHAATTHELPLPPRALGDRKMLNVFRNILEYLKKCQWDDRFVVFTPSKGIPMVTKCFSYLGEGCGVELIKVLDLHYLFFMLKKVVMDVAGFPDPGINKHVTDMIFKRDTFDLAPEIACQYHEEIDRTKYCTQSMVTRWAYTFCDYMCGNLAIALQPGKHKPLSNEPNPDASISIEAFWQEIQSQDTEMTSTSRPFVASSTHDPTDHTAFASDLKEERESPRLGRRFARGRRTSGGSRDTTLRDPFYSPSGSRFRQEILSQDTETPSRSQHSVASSSNVPTDHTTFTFDLSEVRESPRLGRRFARGRRTSGGSRDTPTGSRFRQEILSQGTETPSSSQHSIASRSYVSSDHSAFASDLNEEREFHTTGRRFARGRKISGGSRDPLYSLPGPRSRKENHAQDTEAPPSSPTFVASSSFAATDHTSFASDLNKDREFHMIGRRFARGRRTFGGTRNTTLRDPFYSLPGSGKENQAQDTETPSTSRPFVASSSNVSTDHTAFASDLKEEREFHIPVRRFARGRRTSGGSRDTPTGSRFRQGILFQDTETPSSSLHSVASRSYVPSDNSAFASDLNEEREFHAIGRRFTRGLRISGGSRDPLYPLPGSRSWKENQAQDTEAPSSSRPLVASSSFVPTDHTSFASDFNEEREFHMIGRRFARGRRTFGGTRNTTLRERNSGAWDLPTSSHSLLKLTDKDLSKKNAN
nr:protein maelstrom-like [Drosophila suzukii]